MKCVVCGKKAGLKNNLGLPSCKDHVKLSSKPPACPDCEGKMKLQNQKNGGFWRCESYPNCFGTRDLENPHEEPDLW
jgi:ssDNA-binding Zn-finger/Zn-ribbon topoisomerase 1